LLATPDFYNDISGFPIGTFISLALEYNLITFGHTRKNFQGVMSGVIDDLGSTAMRTDFLNDLASTSTFITAICINSYEPPFW
jgi:hypothetical protein